MAVADLAEHTNVSARFGLLLTIERRTMRFLVLLYALMAATAAAAPVVEVTGHVSVVDGDTIEIHGRLIRLYGIDAPEAGQTCSMNGRPYRCGEEAALALSDFIGARLVACEKCDIDSYERIVAVCRVDGEDVGAWMVSQGWALAYSNSSSDYVDEELGARANKRGLWRGTFMMPCVKSRPTLTPPVKPLNALRS